MLGNNVHPSMDASFTSISTAITVLNNESVSRALTPCDISNNNETFLSSTSLSRNIPSASSDNDFQVSNAQPVLNGMTEINLNAFSVHPQGVDNAGYQHDEEPASGNTSHDRRSDIFTRGGKQRLSKKALECPDDLAKTFSSFIVKEKNNAVGGSSSKKDEEDTLRSAFEKTIASIMPKKGNLKVKNRVDAGGKENANGGKDKGTNTEPMGVVMGPRSELHKSFSVGCLTAQADMMRHANGCSLTRSESLDTCLQGGPNPMMNWRNMPPPPYPHDVVVDMRVLGEVVVEPPTGKKRRPPVRAQSTLSTCSYRSDSRVCRICWLGEEKESCIQPCHCSGSSASVHVSCLQKWLSVTQNFKCEICLYEFKTKKKCKPLKKWRWKLAKSRQRSQLEATVILLAIVTPPLICGIILCSQKIVEFLSSPDQSWGATGMPLALMTLVLASTITYLVAVIYFLKKLGAVCHQWMTANKMTIVKLGEEEHVVDSAKLDQPVWAIS